VIIRRPLYTLNSFFQERLQAEYIQAYTRTTFGRVPALGSWYDESQSIGPDRTKQTFPRFTPGRDLYETRTHVANRLSHGLGGRFQTPSLSIPKPFLGGSHTLRKTMHA
jgi:hypothetical protein